MTDAYGSSVALRKLRSAAAEARPIRMGCFDIDSTLTGDHAMADEVRRMLDTRGFITMMNTSRTEEMLMSTAVYEATRHLGWFHRPPPHLGCVDGHRVYVPPEEYEPWGILDPDIIASSTGTKLLIRQMDGTYLPDTEYMDGAESEPVGWRRDVSALLNLVDAAGMGAQLSAIEYEDNFESGLTDVYPPDYRMQIEFESLAAKQELAQRLSAIRMSGGSDAALLARSLRLTDDSEPSSGQYKVYLAPRRFTKARAIQRVVSKLSAVAGVSRGHVGLFIAGDSFPDLLMGLLGGSGAPGTLLLAGGSRLTPAIMDENVQSFAGEHLRAIKRRLEAASQRGYYRFRMPCAHAARRRVVVGDAAFPGTEAVETVYEYLLRM